MSEMEYVREALAPLMTFPQTNDGIAIPTYCLYPSNSAVTVYVTGGASGSVVSDEGGAVDELSTHNRDFSSKERDRLLRRFSNPVGLKSHAGKIYTAPVSMEQLASSILLVANASASAARWGFDHIKSRHRRDLREELGAVLERQFEKSRIEPGVRLIGKSTRSYKFQNVIRLDRDRRLVVDAVLPDANSINSHAIAHLDLNQLNDEKIIQRMVYHDDDNWDAADLNLLQMATTLVALSRVSLNFQQFAEQ